MSDYPYVPKHDTSKVKPFAPNPKKYTFQEFLALLDKKKLNEIAYWFEQKENKNPDFKFLHDPPDSPSPYKMNNFLGSALERAILNNDKDMAEFLLFDPLVKQREWLKEDRVRFLEDMFDYSNIHIKSQHKDIVVFCLSQGVIGPSPFTVEFPLPWLREALGLLPPTHQTISFLSLLEKNLWANLSSCLKPRKSAQNIVRLTKEERLRKQYPNEYDALLIVQSFLKPLKEKRMLNKAMGIMDVSQAQKTLNDVNNKLSRLQEEEKSFTEKTKTKRELLLKQKTEIEKQLSLVNQQLSKKPPKKM